MAIDIPRLGTPMVDSMSNKTPRKRARARKRLRNPAVAGKVIGEERVAPIGLERLFTIDQIVRLGGPCRAKLYDDIKAGRLKAKKFGRSTRITEGAYRAYVASAPSLDLRGKGHAGAAEPENPSAVADLRGALPEIS